jgi:enoyl-CoA hydratase
MASKYVKVSKRDGVALVRFDRGGSLNAFNQDLILELTKVAQSFHDDPKTRAVILTGRSDAFAAGIDLNDPKRWNIEDLPFEQQRSIAYRGGALCRAWEEIPQPTIAAIEGMAVGAGVALAISCDWRVLSEAAFLYVPEVKVGLNLSWHTMPRLLNLVNAARAKRIVILCERMQAAQALDWGLVDEVSKSGGAVAKARELADVAVSMPVTVTRMTKETINATANALHRVSSFMDADQAASLRYSPDAVAARKAFTQKAGRRKSK